MDTETATYPSDTMDDNATDADSSLRGSAPPSSTPEISSRTLSLDKAKKIIKAYTENPSWLADPRTSHAANSVFSAAAKVVGMNIQMERINAQAEATKLKLNTDTRLINHLNDGLAKLKDMTVVAAIRDEVQANGPTPKAISMLNQQLESEKPLLEPEPMSMTLNDGTEVVGWVDPKTRKFTQYRPPQERSGGATQYPEPIIKEIGGRPFLFYRNFAPKPLDRLNAQQQVQANVNAAALKAARLAITKAFDEDSKAAAQKEYDRQLGIFNDYFEVINADKGKVGPAPTNAPASPTNAPQKIGRFLVTPQ